MKLRAEITRGAGNFSEKRKKVHREKKTGRVGPWATSLQDQSQKKVPVAEGKPSDKETGRWQDLHHQARREKRKLVSDEKSKNSLANLPTERFFLHSNI